jgi:hypothetical protein
MPKPQSRNELIGLSQKNYKTLMNLVNSYSEEEIEKEFPEGTMNRNIRDVLAHLHHWHLMMLDWYNLGMNGEKPDMPAKGYTWKTLPELNKRIWQEYQNTDLETVKRLLDTSFKNVQALITNHTDKELFEKKRYKWTGSTSLGAYLISNTSSHYDWAIKRIKKSMK